MTDRPQIYLTKQQAARLAAITLDAQSGAQIESTTDAESYVTGCFVPLNRSHDLSFFTIDADGTYHDTT